MTWLACAVLVVAAGCYVLIPLFREPKEKPDEDLPDEMELDRLMDRKSVIYRGIRDLDFEHAMGRLSDADCERLQADYKNDAALILQRLDQLGVSDAFDNAIEREIAARKVRLTAAPEKQKSSSCPSCGAETVPGKKYCADCGERL